MKTVLLIRDLDLGGAQRQLVQLASGLVDAGDDVTVVVWRPGGSLEQSLGPAGAKFVVLKAGVRGNIVQLARGLRRIVLDNSIDVVYAMMPVANFVASLGCARTGAIVVWGIRTSANAVRKGPVSQQLLFLVQQVLGVVPSALIVNSVAGRTLAGRFVSAGSLHLVRNGTNTDYFRPAESLRIDYRAELRIAQSATVVSVVGRLEPQKGLKTLLDALSNILPRRPSLVVLLVGRGDAAYLDRLRRRIGQIDDQGQVRIVGQHCDIRRIYGVSDVLVSPSAGEGMSNVVIEAMACGLRVVASDVGDNAAVMGDCGWIVQSMNSSHLQLALESAIDCRDLEVGLRARARVERLFSVEAMVGSTRAVLKDAVGKTRRGE